MEKQKLLIIVAIVVAVVILVLALGLKRDKGPVKQVTLEFWSVYDDEEVYRELIEDFQKANRHINIKYQEKSSADYERDLINTLAAEGGPDIFSIHNSWLPKHKDKISPMPQTEGFMSLENFQDTFVDVVYSDFITKEEKEDKERTVRGIGRRAEEEEEEKEEIYAIPLYVDTLALYYNKDLFNSAGIPSPPTTWEELLDDVYKLTERDEWGNIERSGIAMGTAENINRSTDILSLLMLQVGTQMTDENHLEATFNQRIRSGEERFNPGEDALRFYTDFSNSTKRIYCWNRQMLYSIDAFSQRKAAMMINYSHRIDAIRNISSYLNFEVVSVPQVKDRELDVNYANYWGHTVSKKSEYPEEAWKFILFLIQEENVKKYLEKAKRPTSRRDLIEWQKDNPDLDVFANQVLTAKSWYQADSQTIEIIFADMIESVVSKKATIGQAINTAADQVNVLMKK